MARFGVATSAKPKAPVEEVDAQLCTYINTCTYIYISISTDLYTCMYVYIHTNTYSYLYRQNQTFVEMCAMLLSNEDGSPPLRS